MNGISKSLINTTFNMFKMPTSMDISQSARESIKPDTAVLKDNFETENSKHPSKKKYIIAAAVIAASAILVGVGIKTGKIKNIFKGKSKPSNTTLNDAGDAVREGVQNAGTKPPVHKPKAPIINQPVSNPQSKAPVIKPPVHTPEPKAPVIKPLPLGLPEKSSATLAHQTQELMLQDVISAHKNPVTPSLPKVIELGGSQAKITPPQLPLGLPEKSSATIAQEALEAQNAALDAQKAARKAQKWAEKSAKLGAEAQTKTPLPKVIELGGPQEKITPPSLPLALPEKSSVTLARQTSDLAVKDVKHTQMNLAITAFVAGILSKGFKDFKNAQSRELEKLEKFADENREMIKEEAPRIMAEANRHKEIYETKTTPVIEEKIEPMVENTRRRLNMAVKMFNSCDTSYSHVDYGKGAEANLVIDNDNQGNVRLISFSRDDQAKSQETLFVDGVAKEITIFNPNTQKPYVRGVVSQDARGRNYISNFFVYNRKTGVMTGSMVYDHNNTAKTFFSRNKEGKINKVYNIDKNNNLSAVALPDEEGKRCNRRYVYKDGTIDKAFISKSDTAPRRTYFFKDGQPQEISLYGEKVEMPVEGKKKLVDTVYSIPFQ